LYDIFYFFFFFCFRNIKHTAVSILPFLSQNSKRLHYLLTIFPEIHSTHNVTKTDAGKNIFLYLLSPNIYFYNYLSLKLLLTSLGCGFLFKYIFFYNSLRIILIANINVLHCIDSYKWFLFLHIWEKITLNCIFLYNCIKNANFINNK
jgi:hypothetical protein